MQNNRFCNTLINKTLHNSYLVEKYLQVYCLVFVLKYRLFLLKKISVFIAKCKNTNESLLVLNEMFKFAAHYVIND